MKKMSQRNKYCACYLVILKGEESNWGRGRGKLPFLREGDEAKR